MQKCENCGITLRTHHKDCPLCHGALTGEFDENDRLFPIVPPKKPPAESLFMQWFSFGALVICIVCSTINYMTFSGMWWCAFVAGALFCAWLVTYMALHKRRSPLKSIMWQLVMLVLLCIGWDYFTGWKNWSLDYVLPIAVIAALGAMLVVAAAMKLTSPEYMTYVLMVCLCGIAPVILVITGAITTPLPSVICAAVCFITFVAMLIFRRKAMVNELGKKFHV